MSQNLLIVVLLVVLLIWALNTTYYYIDRQADKKYLSENFKFIRNNMNDIRKDLNNHAVESNNRIYKSIQSTRELVDNIDINTRAMSLELFEMKQKLTSIQYEMTVIKEQIIELEVEKNKTKEGIAS